MIILLAASVEEGDRVEAGDVIAELDSRRIVALLAQSEASRDLAADGTAILVSTHFMDEAERCHFLAILDEGRKVADGTPGELKNAIGATVVEIEVAEPTLEDVFMAVTR